MRIHTHPKDEKVLRTKADRVDHMTDELKGQIKEMLDVMKQSGGIGLAAQQVGIIQRVIVLDTRNVDKQTAFFGEMINPVILEKSPEKMKLTEGCLSFPGKTVDVARSPMVKVNYQNVAGKKKFGQFVGMTAICIQHEIDHLDGVLFIDY